MMGLNPTFEFKIKATMKEELTLYKTLLTDIKTRVRQGQLRANLSANA
jgi:hypothetical protein